MDTNIYPKVPGKHRINTGHAKLGLSMTQSYFISCPGCQTYGLRTPYCHGPVLPRPAKAVQFSLDGLKLVSGSDDTSVRHWDLSTGTCIQVLRGHEVRQHLLLLESVVSYQSHCTCSCDTHKHCVNWQALHVATHLAHTVT